MSKVIEADFLPRETDITLSWSNLRSSPSFNQARRVLVIDNDRNTTRLVKILLENRGDYLVLEENEPARAHQSALNFRPDIILLDIVMPETDGGEVAARIERDPKLQGTPIIFLTALVTKSEAKNGLEIQGHSFLAKPISIPELVEAIEQRVSARGKASHPTMKAPIFTIILIAALFIGSHGASAATRHYSSSHSATIAHKRQATERQRRAVELQPEVTGVIPRAIRGGNPLQMFNPFAPRKYGTAEESVVPDPADPKQGDGIKLLGFSF